MENQIALLIIIIVIALSKRAYIPIVFAVFYFAYLSIDGSAPPEGAPDSEIRAWAILNAIISLSVLALLFAVLATGDAYIKTTFLCMIYIMSFYIVPELSVALGVGSLFESEVILMYEGLMNYTIFIDILFCVVGSDNVLSRQIFKGK